LFVQKWDEKLCPKKDDYNIFFATMQEPSKNSSGDKIYVRKRDFQKENIKVSKYKTVSETPNVYEITPKILDEYLLDAHGHLIVKHDLFNHDGQTKDGIAEAFIEFAKKERLSFF
jgi:type I restriction enzyme M protein